MNPFTNPYFNWALPLISTGWGIVTIAIPPEDNIPYVSGNLECVMDTLFALVDGAKNPGPEMLPIRHIMPPYMLNIRLGVIVIEFTWP